MEYSRERKIKKMNWKQENKELGVEKINVRIRKTQKGQD